MGLFGKKKQSPEELQTKLSMTSGKLENRERQLKSQQNQAKEEAKNALKNGDERGFRLASKRHAMLNSQLNAMGGMVEMAQGMRDVIEMQEGLKEVVEIGSMLKDYQDQMGIDTKQMEAAVTNIRTSMEKVNSATEMISTTMEAVSSGDVEVGEAQESLKAELMAEIESEKGQTTGIEEKINKEKEKI
jgi:hypothetical protein